MTNSVTKTPESIRSEIAELVEQFAALTYAPKPFISGETPVPVSGKVIGAAELKNMVEASLDGSMRSSKRAWPNTWASST